MKRKTATAERRRWPRLALAIPVFVRGGQELDREFLEFATALNVSAGGMLLAVRRSLNSAVELSLEIPSAPLAALSLVPRAARTFSAKVLRIQHNGEYSLVGLKFSRPLEESRSRTKTVRRKIASSV